MKDVMAIVEESAKSLATCVEEEMLVVMLGVYGVLKPTHYVPLLSA